MGGRAGKKRFVMLSRQEDGGGESFRDMSGFEGG
jgi:hypothetical protein